MILIWVITTSLIFTKCTGFTALNSLNAKSRVPNGVISYFQLHQSAWNGIIHERTQSCLDFEVILKSLTSHTKTVLGTDTCGEYFSTDHEVVNSKYSMMNQLLGHIGLLPLHSSLDVWSVLKAIELNSSPPDKEELAMFSFEIDQIVELYEFMLTNMDSLDLFTELINVMELPTELVDSFHQSFDEEMDLNVEKYPEIKRIKAKIDSLRGQIVQTMNSLLQSQEIKEKIADNGYVEMEGRYCLMLKNTYKKGVGIVHGSSNTGRTIYVEPMQVVEPTNELKTEIARLREEENKIFFEMCQCISRNREAVERSARAVAEVDIIRAKCKLGESIGGIIPEVGCSGEIRCRDAKHPILLLRQSQYMDGNGKANSGSVVGNDIEMHKDSTALVISGPNAGGKTIVLKTAGLFALMVQHSIPIPAQKGARVDVFAEVMADIGDMQSVSGDLSTFSGHLVICREILQRAADLAEGSNGGTASSLVLLDEIGTGTDPAQGAALAQAVLEDLVALGSRVMVTTHYQRIKELAACDERFRIAAMEFVENKPTYRLRAGSVGESFALEAARRMSLPERVLGRANVLLDDESRRLLALQQQLEQETEQARLRQEEFESKLKQLTDREKAVEKADATVRDQIAKIREGKTDEYLLDLKEKERELEQLVRQAKKLLVAGAAAATATTSSGGGSASSGGVPSKSTIEDTERALEELKITVKTQRIETEKEKTEKTQEELQADPLEPGEPIEAGTTLVVMEPGTLFGSKGVTTQRNKGRGRVLIRVAGVEVKKDRHLLGKPRLGTSKGKLGIFPGGGGKLGDKNNLDNMSAKDRRLYQMLEEELVDPDKLLAGNKKLRYSAERLASSKTSGKVVGVARTERNTLDLREVEKLPEAQKRTMKFMQKVLNEQVDAGFGAVMFANHGTHSPIKDKYRGWLKKNPLVNRHHSADLSSGGDAVTVIELHTDDS